MACRGCGEGSIPWRRPHRAAAAVARREGLSLRAGCVGGKWTCVIVRGASFADAALKELRGGCAVWWRGAAAADRACAGWVRAACAVTAVPWGGRVAGERKGG